MRTASHVQVITTTLRECVADVKGQFKFNVLKEESPIFLYFIDFPATSFSLSTDSGWHANVIAVDIIQWVLHFKVSKKQAQRHVRLIN